MSKVENNRLKFGDSPSETLIQKLAEALEADEDELWLIANRIPPKIKNRVLERPTEFSALADLDDQSLHRLISGLQECQQKQVRS